MKPILYWFRNNLRLHDNPSLSAAVSLGRPIIPVYVLDSRFVNSWENASGQMGQYRYRFLMESLNDLAIALSNSGSRLILRFGNPAEVLVDMANEYQVESLIGSKEVNPYEIGDEQSLSKTLQASFIHDGLLYDVESLPFELSKLPLSFSSFRKKVERKTNRVDPITPITSVPFDDTLNHIWSLSPNRDLVEFDSRSAHPFIGGESHGMARVASYLWENKNIRSYKETRNGLIGRDYSSKLSAYLALGCLSPRMIVAEVKRHEQRFGANSSTYWLFFELLWREFFRLNGLRHGSDLFAQRGIQKVHATGVRDLEAFHTWSSGQTGHDFIDANMNELRLTGFMSNRGRQNAASYLIHEMNLDWRLGAKWFEKHLVDYDCSSNWGNWMYITGNGNARREVRFDIDWQQDRYDPDGEYVRLWHRTIDQ